MKQVLFPTAITSPQTKNDCCLLNDVCFTESSDDSLDMRTSSPLSTNSEEEILSLPVEDLFEQHINSLDEFEEDAFFVADIGELYRQHKKWVENLPRIEPFYAMKCNPNPVVLSVLNQLGCNFDCASKAEVEAVLNIGVDPSRIIYANPCKPVSHLRFARDRGVTMMTFDNADELRKIKKVHPEAELVLRVLTDDSKSICQLGLKFGTPLNMTYSLLKTAKELDLNVIGVSFHVGSGCQDSHAFSDAVQRARRVFDEAESLGFNFTLLDVGGGFPGERVPCKVTFDEIVKALVPTVDALFPPHIRVIAEPGRYFAASTFSLAVNVTARRDMGESFMYYVNDGVYGSFNCLVFDHATVTPSVLVKDSQFRHGVIHSSKHGKKVYEDGPIYKSSLWGPTCDSIDCITKEAHLPKLEVGDWLIFESMGAYTMCAASTFNGFRKSYIRYTNTEN